MLDAYRAAARWLKNLRPGGQVPGHDPGLAGPSLVCGLLVFAVPSYLCPSLAPSRPKTPLRRATRAHRNKPGRRPHLKSRHGADTNLIPCASQGTPTRHGRSMPCPGKDRATCRCFQHDHGAGSVMPKRHDAPRAGLRRNEAGGLHHLRRGGRTARSGDDGVDRLFQRTGLGRRPRRFLPGPL